ncbi:MAG: hypothetical protein GC185_03820 [Alphaproteobacteria bacterium]|nr:hypothetical protein [Alphaproteobacteria bacterium]
MGIFSKKEQAPTRVGAKEKIAKARALHGGPAAQIESQREGGKGKTSPTVVVVTYYVMASALAFVLMQGPLKDGLQGVSIGVDGLDTVFFGGSNQNFFGDPLIDSIILSMIRGIPILFVAGVLPLLAILWTKVRDNPNMNPYMTVWGVSIGTVLLFFASKMYIFPFLGDIFTQITS